MAGVLTSLIVTLRFYREPLITNIMWRNLLIQVHVLFLILEQKKLFFLSLDCFSAEHALSVLYFFGFFFTQAVYQITVLLILNFRGKSILNLEHDTTEHADKVKNTLIFNTFVLCQVSPFQLLRSCLYLRCILASTRVVWNSFFY